MTPRPPSEDELDDIAAAAIPILDALGGLAHNRHLNDPRCQVTGCEAAAATTAWVHYFAEPEDKELTQAVLKVCRPHARKLWELFHPHRRLNYAGRPVVNYATRDTL